MVTYVLDACALLRYIDGEAGADRIAQLLVAHASATATLVMSAVNWGEVITALLRKHGSSGVDKAQTGLNDLGIIVIAATASRAERSARIRFKYKLPYADAFCLELAGDSADRIVITADFDFKPAESDYRIEFLPSKPKP